MKLKKIVLDQLDNNHSRLRLALALKVSEITVRRYITDNSENLTKAASLQEIRTITGLPDSEILIESNDLEVSEINSEKAVP